MENTDLILNIVFIVGAVFYIALIHKLPFTGDFALKAIPALSLATMALLFVPGVQGKLLFMGLLLSAGGDVSLSFQGEKFFLTGLVFFLLAHVSYVVTFAMDKPYTTERWPMLIVFAVFAIGMAAILNPKLGEMRIPVFVYVAVILTMGIFATLRTGERPWMLIAGAGIFMLSDSLIAVDKFLKPIPGAHYLIMLTYYTGQYLICRSFVQGPAFPF